MNVPFGITYRGVERTDSIDELIRKKIAKLERACSYISSCRVAIERDQMHQDSGNPYRIRIDMTVPPGHEVVIRRETSEGYLHDSLAMMIRLAFRAAQRALTKLADRQHYEIKSHIAPSETGTVVRLFPEMDYGFIETTDGRDIYFHRNSVIHDGFDRLVIGATVRFVDEMGINGPQASTVDMIEKPARTQIEASSLAGQR